MFFLDLSFLYLTDMNVIIQWIWCIIVYVVVQGCPTTLCNILIMFVCKNIKYLLVTPPPPIHPHQPPKKAKSKKSRAVGFTNDFMLIPLSPDIGKICGAKEFSTIFKLRQCYFIIDFISCLLLQSAPFSPLKSQNRQGRGRGLRNNTKKDLFIC